MPQTRQNLHNFGRVFWKAQAIDPLQNGKALRKRAFLVQLDGAMQAHDLRTRHAGAAIFIDFHLVVPGGTTVFQSHEICDQIEESLKNHLDDAKVTIHVEPEHKSKQSGAIIPD
ncbi:cation transporter dimerization domain-containing protein [Paracoccus fistulariae]|jgi:divalent metal cation (Fe/Co/Zn/Cd) transporter|uniref:Cation efflux protein cytoplasmic domain-containing protein n=1 Tax=Paracoccus fistulariae TaxID=658446 RepID=A0ABY7SQB5_9RHOB|nr:hypothetical protein JHX87_18355 [Paracoccus fistulariae]